MSGFAGRKRAPKSNDERETKERQPRLYNKTACAMQFSNQVMNAAGNSFQFRVVGFGERLHVQLPSARYIAGMTGISEITGDVI